MLLELQLRPFKNSSGPILLQPLTSNRHLSTFRVLRSGSLHCPLHDPCCHPQVIVVLPLVTDRPVLRPI